MPPRSKPASASASAETSICPWCSATVPAEASRCPSCNAVLRDLAADAVPGVTQVDMAATSKLARLKPGPLAVWLGAERTTENPELEGRVEEPSDEVRQEMLKMKLAALDAEIEAKRAAAEANSKLPPEDASGPSAT